jgi:hypothetical protein
MCKWQSGVDIEGRYARTFASWLGFNTGLSLEGPFANKVTRLVLRITDMTGMSWSRMTLQLLIEPVLRLCVCQ